MLTVTKGKAITSLVLSLVVISCDQGKPSMDMYVLVEPRHSERFMKVLAEVTRSQGLSPWSGHATDDRGRILHVLEAKRRFVRVWAQNMPMNALEDPRCSPLGDAEIDPGQFMISVESTFPFLGSARARSTFPKLRKALANRGYKVLGEPLACSLLAGENSE